MTEQAPPGGAGSQDELRRIALQTAKGVLALQQRTDDELRQAKVALELRTDELEVSLSLLMATIESTPDGIVVDNMRGKIVVHNSRFTAMWAVPAEMMQRRDVAEVVAHAMAQIKDAPAFRKRLDAMRAQPERDAHVTVELHDGRIFERWVSAHRVGGVCMGTVANWRDVTERRRAADAVRERDLAERANRAKNDFIGRVSHELRTPLNAVLGFSEVMQLDEREPLPPAQRQRAERIHNAGSHLLRLIDDLLDVSRLEAGSVHLHFENVDVAEVLQEAVDDLQERARGLDVDLVFEPEGSATPQARSDRIRLKQILHNLLSNAVKYNRPRGSVRASLRRRGHEIRVMIADTGLGMDARQLERLFQPFDRLGRESSPIEGTGIGLVIARSLAELLGGGLTVNSELGHGSEFVVSLPMASDGSEETGHAVLSHWPALDTVPLLHGKLLYVEDDAVNCLLMQAFLELRPGIELVIAGDGRSGIAAAASTQFALVMIDMMLPDMSGSEVLAGIRALPARAQVPCMAVSANAMPTDIAHAMAAGFDGYITKPLSSATLLHEIDRVATVST
jgi:PAS domain S-box-containing protein